MKFGAVDSQKVIKIITTRCQIFRLKCTKIDIAWDSAPDSGAPAHSAPPELSPDSIAGIKGTIFKGKGGIREGRVGECMRGEGRGKEE